jgi:hypothetical protein
MSGLTVQCRLEDVRENEDEDDYHQVDCPACGSSHFVNEKTGKILGRKWCHGDMDLRNA